ncbi:porin [Silvimonas sp.]|uniref:porin n=1 Tax=Silvimonas sp. TaxID=2650811 RepID=UPI00283D0CA3|nr:porin [Silvimonas sp.]MDR3428116.1 porin [Silvimonas sp.]
MFKRALLVTALTAAFAAPAFADVSISGSAEMDIFVRTHQDSSLKADGSSSSAAGNETDLILNFDGNDKLDNGNKLIWRVSQKVATPATAAWGSREAYIGLTGDWGTFRSGRVFAPSYLALDEFQNGAGNLWEDYGANAVWFKEALAYTSPDFGGFNVQVAYDLGTKNSDGQAWALDAIATYKGNGLSLAGGYQKQKGLAQADGANVGNVTFDTLAWNQDDAYSPSSGGFFGNDIQQEMYFAQGNWDVGNGFSLRAGWKHNKWVADGWYLTNGREATSSNDQFLLGGAYRWGKQSIALGWQDVVNSKVGGEKINDMNMNQLYGQYTYGMSKNTVAYVQARYMKFKSEDARPFATATWQLDGVASSGTDNGARVLIGTWTGF